MEWGWVKKGREQGARNRGQGARSRGITFRKVFSQNTK